MKKINAIIYSLAIAFLVTVVPSCKSKKKIQKDEPVTQEAVNDQTNNATPQPAQQDNTPVDRRPDFNFHAVQFDLNSGRLRPDAIQYLEHIAAEMRKDPNTRFVVNGYASSEGTAKHNMTLSLNRANAVKRYMVHLGIADSRLIVKAYGMTRSVATNSTVAGREKNRRVEVKLIH